MQANLSEIKINATGRVTDGKLVFPAADLERIIKVFDGKTVAITANLPRKKRSERQNKWYWGAIVPFVKRLYSDAGMDYSPAQIHDFLNRFLPEKTPVVDMLTGEVYAPKTRYSKLSTVAFMAFVDNINKYLMELNGSTLPTPDDLLHLDENRFYIEDGD
ncbi:MAG TPA: hypothetical protein PKE69_20995 [Pyrinomonadaceae bacterium]|nr:hypothetical protein [Pyrinomonadaceae bacterium]